MAGKQKKSQKMVQVNRGKSAKPPEDLVTEAHEIQKACNASAAFQGHPSCKANLLVWMAATDALDANATAQKDKRAELAALEKDEPGLVIEYANTKAEFIASAQTAANDNPALVVEWGLERRAESVHGVQVTVPEGLRIEHYKTTGAPKLAWNEVPGALMYTPQMSVAPPTDSSWDTLYGHGLSRKVPDMTPGQEYVFRVCAVGTDGKPTAWSQTVSYLAS